LSYAQVDELQGEVAAITDEFTTATAKYANVASTVVDHNDRANLLQFKLQGKLAPHSDYEW
jgi:hypothetical protein